MTLGIGLYKHMLNREHYRFARQAGCTHVVAHLVDYFRGLPGVAENQPVGGSAGWGLAGDPDRLWSPEELLELRREINEEGLELAGIENFDPAHWYDVLLDGPEKSRQLENLKTIIRRLGKAGIPIMGYNFSIAGVSSRVSGPFARGGAESVGMDGVDQTPVPRGMVWNMTYDPDAEPGTVAGISHEELWQRLADFLHAVAPVAEQEGVTLAAHPDDPPMPEVRSTPRLVYQPHLYQRLLDIHPSPANSLEFCLGTVAEMTDGDVYEAVDRYSRQGRIAYIHFRNIRGKVPRYREVFLDEGDVDMVRVLQILRRNGYQGLLVPDHTPQMTCPAPWHAGMAFALGYMRSALSAIRS